MKSLPILRHAKASRKHPELTDHQKTLNKRSRNDAPRIGKLLKKEKIVTDDIISSTAVRAYETAKLVAKASGYKREIILDESLYLTGPKESV